MEGRRQEEELGSSVVDIVQCGCSFVVCSSGADQNVEVSNKMCRASGSF